MSRDIGGSDFDLVSHSHQERKILLYKVIYCNRETDMKEKDCNNSVSIRFAQLPNNEITINIGHFVRPSKGAI